MAKKSPVVAETRKQQEKVAAYKGAKYADAVELFKQAVALDASNVNGRLYLATAYMSQYIPGAESPGTPTSPGGEPPGGRASVPEASRTLGSQPASRTLAWLRQFAKLWGFALFCIFVVYFFREVALPFLFAILVAYILAPLVDRLAAADAHHGESARRDDASGRQDGRCRFERRGRCPPRGRRPGRRPQRGGGLCPDRGTAARPPCGYRLYSSPGKNLPWIRRE